MLRSAPRRFLVLARLLARECSVFPNEAGTKFSWPGNNAIASEEAALTCPDDNPPIKHEPACKEVTNPAGEPRMSPLNPFSKRRFDGDINSYILNASQPLRRITRRHENLVIKDHRVAARRYIARPMLHRGSFPRLESAGEAAVIFNNLTANPYKAAPFVKRQITADTVRLRQLQSEIRRRSRSDD